MLLHTAHNESVINVFPVVDKWLSKAKLYLWQIYLLQKKLHILLLSYLMEHVFHSSMLLATTFM